MNRPGQLDYAIRGQKYLESLKEYAKTDSL